MKLAEKLLSGTIKSEENLTEGWNPTNDRVELMNTKNRWGYKVIWN